MRKTSSQFVALGPGLLLSAECGSGVSASARVVRPADHAPGSSPKKRVFGTAIRESFAGDANLGRGVRRAQHASRRICFGGRKRRREAGAAEKREESSAQCAPAVEEALFRETRVGGVSREKARGRGSRSASRRHPRAWAVRPDLARVAHPSAGCRIQGSREHPGRLRAVGGIRGGSPPRISLRGSKRLSTREDVARGAHVGRDSRVRHPCRSRGWKGNASLDPRPRM